MHGEECNLCDCWAVGSLRGGCPGGTGQSLILVKMPQAIGWKVWHLCQMWANYPTMSDINKGHYVPWNSSIETSYLRSSAGLAASMEAKGQFTFQIEILQRNVQRITSFSQHYIKISRKMPQWADNPKWTLEHFIDCGIKKSLQNWGKKESGERPVVRTDCINIGYHISCSTCATKIRNCLLNTMGQPDVGESNELNPSISLWNIGWLIMGREYWKQRTRW